MSVRDNFVTEKGVVCEVVRGDDGIGRLMYKSTDHLSRCAMDLITFC